MPLDQFNQNLEKPSPNVLATEIFDEIISKSQEQQIELEDVNLIIREIFKKHNLDPENSDNSLYFSVIGIVIPKYKNKIKEFRYLPKGTQGPDDFSGEPELF